MELTYKEKEMRRMCGAIPKETIDGLKKELRACIEHDRELIRKLENTYPKEFDHHGYKERHNHIDLEGNMIKASEDGFYGTTLIVSDIRSLESEEKSIPISEIMPPVLLNDLVVKTSSKMDDGRKTRYYEIHRYDPETGLFYYSQYEFRFAMKQAVDKKPVPIIAVNQSALHEETQIIPAHLELVQSAVYPLRWVTAMLITGMWGEWEDTSFYDFPVLFTWFEDKPYRLYRDFAKENLTKDERHAILEDVLEASIGFQRYLIKLSENRDKVNIKKEKTAPKAVTGESSAASANPLKESVRHVISLDRDIKVYTKGTDAVKSFRHPQKCMYRYSVRGHFRHYKNGKVVWVKPFDKNKDKPFSSHQYGA